MPATISTEPLLPEAPPIVKAYEAAIASHRSPLMRSCHIGYDFESSEWRVLLRIGIGGLAFTQGFRIDEDDDIETQFSIMRGSLYMSLQRWIEDIRALAATDLPALPMSSDRIMSAAMLKRALDALVTARNGKLSGLVVVGATAAFPDVHAVQFLVTISGRRFEYAATGILVPLLNEAPRLADAIEIIASLLQGLVYNLQIGISYDTH